MQMPSLGRIVMAIVNPDLNNGSDVCPAVVTRVWGDDANDGSWTVNVRTVADGLPTEDDQWLTSRKLFSTEQEARDCGAGSCFWPPRV